MKIAVPARDGYVDDHFGHCEYFMIYSIADRNIIGKEMLAAPSGCGCKSGIIAVLHQMNVSVMLAGNMGEGAKNKLSAFGIEVIRGCKGEADTVVQRYLEGNIADSTLSCSGGHSCQHHEHDCD